MCDRHELPPITGHDDDVSGVIISLRDRANHKKREVLDTSDPLPLHDFGPVIGILSAALLAGAGVGIVLGVIALIDWIRFGMDILPLGEPW